MCSRRASRLVAAAAAVLLAASGVGAALAPRTAVAAKHCCKQRCGHDAAGTLRTCCCATPGSPAASPTVADGRPRGSAPVATPATPRSVAMPIRAATAVGQPPGPPLFLQRCTLVL